MSTPVQTEYQIDTRSTPRPEIWEAVRDAIVEHSRDFRPPIRCLASFADGSVREFGEDGIKSLFEARDKSARITTLEPGRPCTLMFVDADGRELNVLMRVQPPAGPQA